MRDHLNRTWEHSATRMHPGNHPNDFEETRSVITIEVKVNGRVIAEAVAVNESALAEYSDYRVTACEEASPPCGVNAIQEQWQIETHYREQTCWALVEKIAAAMRLFQTEART